MLQLRSQREISQMRKAGLLIWQAHQIAGELVRPGVTSGEIDAAVEEFFRQQEVIPLFMDYPNAQKGKAPFPAVTCMSFNEEVVHGIPGDRKLKEGDILSIDMGCKLKGWCGDAAMTHAVGEIDPESAKLLEVTQGVLQLAIQKIGEGQVWSDVAEPMAAYVADASFSTVEDFVGHGIGQEMHEDPQVPNYVSSQLRTRRGNFALKPGLVIAVEPMVNIGTKRVKMLADDWTMVTRDGSGSAHFEHTIAVTPEGPRVLTAPPKEDEPEWVEWGRDRLRAPADFEKQIVW